MDIFEVRNVIVSQKHSSTTMMQVVKAVTPEIGTYGTKGYIYSQLSDLTTN
jgi:hypothetical protein